MPNHITNAVTIKHTNPEKIKWLKSIFIVEENGATMDFDKIIPMPKELRETVSPVELVVTQGEADKINEQYKNEPLALMMRGGQTIKAITYFEHERRMKEYGSDTWYDWACANWGTKWNAYSGRIVKETEEFIACTFDTAWAPPEPIFEKLEEMGFEVEGLWKDEGDDTFHRINEESGDWCVNVEFSFEG